MTKGMENVRHSFGGGGRCESIVVHPRTASAIQQVGIDPLHGDLPELPRRETVDEHIFRREQDDGPFPHSDRVDPEGTIEAKRRQFDVEPLDSGLQILSTSPDPLTSAWTTGWPR